MMMRDKDEEKSGQENQHDSSQEIGHFERQAEVRFHPTASERAGGIHVAAQKAREAQEEYNEKLKGDDDKNEEKSYMEKVEDVLFDQGEKERIARRQVKDDAHKHNQMVNEQIDQQCHEAEQGAS